VPVVGDSHRITATTAVTSTTQGSSMKIPPNPMSHPPDDPIIDPIGIIA